MIEGRNEGLVEGRNEGLVEGRNEGLIEGVKILYKALSSAKMTKDQRIRYIANAYEKDESFIRKILFTI